MSNSLLNISMITKESLMQLKNSLVFTKGANRQYDDSFAKSGAKIGTVINIRKPVRFSVTSGAALSIQDVADQSVALTLDTQKHVGFQFSSKDLTLSIEEFSARYVQPAITALGNAVDSDGLGLYNQVWNEVGVAGTVPNALLTFLQAGQKLDENGCPQDGNRSVVVTPAVQATMVDALKGLFQSSEQIKSQYEKGVMGMTGGFTWKMAQNVKTHTVGALGGTPLASGAGVDGASTLVTKGWTASAAPRLKKGDVITIANVNAVNPQTKLSTGSLMQFVVTADFSSDGSGNGTVSISPSLNLTGAYQNIDALPVDSAAIKIFDQVSTSASKVSPACLAYHKDAFALGCADLALPGGVDMAAKASDSDSGLSLRIVRAYDISNDVFPCRIDMLYGWKAIYPELACRIQS